MFVHSATTLATKLATLEDTAKQAHKRLINDMDAFAEDIISEFKAELVDNRKFVEEEVGPGEFPEVVPPSDVFSIPDSLFTE